MRRWLNNIKFFFRPRATHNHPWQTFREFAQPVKPWWGTFQVEEGQTRFWRVGNVVICVDRFTNEWHLASYPVNKSISNLSSESNPGASDNFQIPFDQLNFTTYTFKTQAEITLTPVLADRPLASQLERPFYIPGGEEIMLYVSSPVWVRVETGGTSKIILDEIPTFFLSDTWFGDNTIEGELCYAGHTHCSTHLKDVPSGPDRIISPMLIKNDSHSMLLLEKLSVPLPQLSVYSDPQNYLWTEQLNVYREGDDEYPEVRVAKGPPKALKDICCLATPRAETTLGFKKLFAGILGG